MNWKRIISASAGVLVCVAVVAFSVKACSDLRDSDRIDSVRDEINSAREAIREVGEKNKELRDSVAMWRDSVDFYKKGLKDCEESKKQPVAKKNPVKKPVRTPKTTPCKDNDTIVVVYEVVRPQDNKGANNSKIHLEENARNNKNIIVQNAQQNGSDTEIILGEGAVNDGNIVVNNGGTVKLNDNRQAIDSLRVAVDSLKRTPQNSAAASSLVIVKKVKVYQRTR